ncbi:MAG: reverse transcriptase domain-containing protein [Candidatus Zixiibacteriota bacterium]
MQLRLTTSDEQAAKRFKELQSVKDVANLLEVEWDHLRYYLYILPDSKAYRQFEITKSTGGCRIIMAPHPSLKILQQKLNHVLQIVYNIESKPSVHGFVKGRSILTNAKIHVDRRWVLNLDITNFFPSINFGRVRGMFMARPHNIPPSC